ncbi:hypothetical protein ZIOFF_071750 [Zingiber officinale]|uniref:Protein kinase domain-containing protein n=1 Tax=Zingiber officinale TaxID=94328 RepID=A0A8J5EQQ9_ZINOF|nr:hypothetical protein ZIOFF_071750 [Zingiber officinale]
MLQSRLGSVQTILSRWEPWNPWDLRNLRTTSGFSVDLRWARDLEALDTTASDKPPRVDEMFHHGNGCWSCFYRVGREKKDHKAMGSERGNGGIAAYDQAQHCGDSNAHISDQVSFVGKDMAMVSVAHPPPGFENKGKNYYTIGRTVLFEIDTKYIPIEPIGRGAYGIVCSSIDCETKEKVAIKKIMNTFENSNRPLRIVREIKLLRQPKHDNIIALKDVMVPPNRRSFRDVYLVFELMDTDLWEIIQSPQPLSITNVDTSSFSVIHRDLKPENLFVNGANCKLKIGDFRLACSMTRSGRGMSSYIATQWYRTPELLVCSNIYDTSIDIWSVGCILAELLGRRPLFPSTNDINQLERIVSVLGIKSDADLNFVDNEHARKYIKSLSHSLDIPLASIYPHANPLAIDLLKKMLVFDPSKRIDVTEALQHPYMASYYDPLLDPAVDGPVDLGFDDDVEEDAIKEMIWEEMLFYHQEREIASRA